MRAADVLARRLYEAGCRWAFGMPGGEVLTLIDALEKAGIEFVLCKHENAAGFMAEGTYHRTGAPGILVSTVGPGVLNGINVVENARQDRVPLIVLSGCIDADIAQTYTHQLVDQPSVLKPITKASFTYNAGAAHVIADKAVTIAMEGQPGPVHIDVPISVADEYAEGEGALRTPHVPVAPAGSALDAARQALANAKSPLIITGVDAVHQEASETIIRAAEVLDAPVITTYKGKGLIPESHALSLGAAGLSPKADGILLPFIQKADVILAIGYDPIEMRVGWQNPWDLNAQTVIDVTAVPNHHYMHHASINIVGDCKASVESLLSEVKLNTWQNNEINSVKAEIQEAFAPKSEWGPDTVIDICRKVLPVETLATADSGAHRILLSQMWQCEFPRGLTQSSGLCTMGCAIPLAMGAQIIEPDRPVVSFSGDAGFLMVAGELATAAERQLKTIFVVFVDSSLALIELKQRQRQMANKGVDFATVDFAKIGEAMGGAGHTVNSKESLTNALNSALNAETFTVIAAQIDRKAYDGLI